MVTVTFRIGLQVVGVSNIQFFLRICNNLANLVNGPIDGWLQLKLADKTLQQAHAYAVESKSKLNLLSIPYLSFINDSLQAQPVAQMTKHRHRRLSDIDSVHQTSIERTYVQS